MNRRGFTLIELTIALSLAVVLFGIVVVRVDGWSSRQELRTSARALGNVIRYFREKAMADEAVYLLTLDLEEGAFSVMAPGARTDFGPPKPLREGSLGRGRTFSRVLIAEMELENPVRIGFGPRGVLPEIRIELASIEGETVTLTLDPLVNRIAYVEERE